MKPFLTWHDKARIEGLPAKLAWLKKYTADKRKVVIVARYISQIDYLAKELAKEREVHVLTGAVKNQEEVIAAARESFENYFLIQSSMGAGFQLPEFSYMIFVSLSFSVRDFIQMRGRILRIDALKSNWIVHLLGGKLDEAVFQRVIKDGLDFTL